MSLLNDILGGKSKNPKEMLIKELEQSDNFLKLLSEALDEPLFKQDPSFKRLNNDIKHYISKCNVEQLKLLLNILKKR